MLHIPIGESYKKKEYATLSIIKALRYCVQSHNSLCVMRL